MATRREFLKGGLSAFAWGMLAREGRGWPQLIAARRPASQGDTSSPFWQLPDTLVSETIGGFPFMPGFSGDNFAEQDIPFHHDAPVQIPVPNETVDVAIVGGGLSGLTTAFLLRRHRPVLFDLRPRFGGNALGETWRETSYSFGSAYVITPDPGTFLNSFYRRLGLHRVKRLSFPPDPMELGGKIRDDYWSGGGMSADEQAAFARYAEVVTYMAEQAYPDIPLSDDEKAAAFVRDLDTRTFRADLEQRMGMPLTPLLAAGVQSYFYSSFGAGMEAISAAGGWNFIAAEEFGRWVFPGGNAYIAWALWKKLRAMEAHGPAGETPRLRAGQRVVDVRRVGDLVQVTSVDPSGQVQALLARYVVMAGSKHIAKHVLHDINRLDPSKRTAMDAIETSAYLVANVLLDAPIERDFYDIFLIGDESYPMTPVEFEQHPRVTDMLNGSYARKESVPRSVLTLYWPLPWFSAPFTLLPDDSWRNYAELLGPQLEHMLGLLDVTPSAVRQVRMTRWGHAVPIAKPGLIAYGTVAELRRPYQERVYFVNQDNWALPAVENSLLDANSVAEEIQGLLR